MKNLAINGGTPAIQPALPERFHFGKEEKAAVDALFDQAIATGKAPGYNGNEETEFCKEFAAELGGGFADGVNAGTNAVFVALRALHLPPFSEVVFGCITDAGGAMPIVMNNCIPIPADTMPGTFMPGPKEIEARITERTSAIVIAHISGDPADMEGIMKVADKYGLPVIEDCAQAPLTTIHGRRAGTFGKAGSFSLMFGKHFCTGGQGGAVFTKDEEFYWDIRRAADRGKPFNSDAGSNLFPALNCNMDEIHAAIGRAQLKKLHDIVRRRRENVKYLLANGLNDLKGCTPKIFLPEGGESCHWWVHMHFNAEKMNCTKFEYIDALNAEGYAPIIRNYSNAYQPSLKWYRDHADKYPWNNPVYKGDPKAEYPCPNAEKALAEDFLIPVYESYTKQDLDNILAAFTKLDAAFAK